MSMRAILILFLVPFWSAPKRSPTSIHFDSENPLHLDYVIAAANLRAHMYGLKGQTDPSVFKKALETVTVPEWKPKSGIKISSSEDDEKKRKEGTKFDDELEKFR